MQDDKTTAVDELLLMPNAEFAELMLECYAAAGSPCDVLAEQRLRQRLATALPAVASLSH